ncbi:hypothetical protein ACIQI8_21610 [Streptomyces sp. NPDC092369]|uniref:hypothetical protein n=1 Tax=Streptomyces sp. NPDC092369 TaxID=3366015 RepID=UPI00381DF8FF
MADEQYRWLDPETAEMLLRGEPLDAVDATSRDEAERLAKTLGALCADVIPPGPELPGEAAALAAFRTARADRSGAAVVGSPTRGRSSDAGLVRIGGPGPDARLSRWRPVRFGLTAVLAAGMLGGVAVAATSGILPTPFGGGGPSPVSSVTAAASPDRPHASPSAKGLLPGHPTPDGPTGGPTASDPAGPGATVAPGSDDRAGGKDGGRWSGGPAACRDLRDGKKLSAERRRALVHAAGGVGGGRVWRYCKNALGDAGSTAKDSDDKGKGKGDGKGDGRNDIGPGGHSGPGDQGSQGGKGDDLGGADDGNHMAPGGAGGFGGTGQSGGPGGSGAVRPLVPTRLTAPAAPTPAPDPTYSAL